MARKPRGAGARTATPARAGGFPTGHGELGESLLFVFPLFLLYGVGLLFSSTVNGVDFIPRLLFSAVGGDRTRYLLLHLVLAAGFLAVVLYLRRTTTFRMRHAVPMLIEAAIYALTLGTAIVFVMGRVFGPVLAVGAADLPTLELPGFAREIVLSAGAGVHEELVFRLGLLSGGTWLLERAGLGRRVAVLIAVLASSLIFSGVHHLGPLGDPWAPDVFVYRALAGLAFAGIYWFRSLGHAVYAHFLYDVYVMAVGR